MRKRVGGSVQLSVRDTGINGGCREEEGGAVTTCLENQCSLPTCNATPSALFSDGQNKTQSRTASQAGVSNYSKGGKIYPAPPPQPAHPHLPTFSFLPFSPSLFLSPPSLSLSVSPFLIPSHSCLISKGNACA